MEMDRPSLVVRALVILAAVTAAAAATIPQASAAKPSTGAQGGPSMESGSPQLATGVPCRVITANPLGVCPPPVIRPAIWQQPRLALFPTLARPHAGDRLEPRMSVLGSGLFPGEPHGAVLGRTYRSAFRPAVA